MLHVIWRSICRCLIDDWDFDSILSSLAFKEITTPVFVNDWCLVVSVYSISHFCICSIRFRQVVMLLLLIWSTRTYFQRVFIAQFQISPYMSLVLVNVAPASKNIILVWLWRILFYVISAFTEIKAQCQDRCECNTGWKHSLGRLCSIRIGWIFFNAVSILMELKIRAQNLIVNLKSNSTVTITHNWLLKSPNT